MQFQPLGDLFDAVPFKSLKEITRAEGRNFWSKVWFCASLKIKSTQEIKLGLIVL